MTIGIAGRTLIPAESSVVYLDDLGGAGFLPARGGTPTFDGLNSLRVSR